MREGWRPEASRDTKMIELERSRVVSVLDALEADEGLINDPLNIGHVDRVERRGAILQRGVEPLVGLDRLVVGVAHQGLRREMKDDLGLCRQKRALQQFAVQQIADAVSRKAFGNARRLEQTGIGRGRECIAMNLGAQPLQPQRQPAALEAGVAGQEDGLALPELRAHPLPAWGQERLGGGSFVLLPATGHQPEHAETRKQHRVGFRFGDRGGGDWIAARISRCRRVANGCRQRDIVDGKVVAACNGVTHRRSCAIENRLETHRLKVGKSSRQANRLQGPSADQCRTAMWTAVEGGGLQAA